MFAQAAARDGQLAPPPGDEEAAERTLTLIGWLRDVCSGVAQIHKHGLVHLDIKSQVSGRFHILCGRFDWDLPICCVFLP
eukprot:COSAG01_NODE_66_length_29241_cov_17.772768_6_plen_80_part_00